MILCSMLLQHSASLFKQIGWIQISWREVMPKNVFIRAMHSTADRAVHIGAWKERFEEFDSQESIATLSLGREADFNILW